MFSFAEIDHVAWVLLLLMAGWVAVNALVDLSGGWTPFRKSKKSAEDHPEPRD